MSPIAAPTPTSSASASIVIGSFPFPLSPSSVSFPETLLRRLQPSQPKLREKFLLRASSPPSTSYKLNKSSETNRRSTCHALPFEISPPPIDHDYAETIAAAEDGTVGDFEDDDIALDAAENGAVVVDLSHYGRIRVSGEDRVQFLHNQSTADFECLAEGQGCDTVFVTPTARTIDIAHALVMKNAITLVVSPVTCERIAKMLEKYIFISDKVEITDLTAQTSMFALVGPASNQIMERLNLADLIGQPYGSHKHYSVNGMPITVSVGSVVSEDGFSLLMSPNTAGTVWKALTAQGAVAMSPTAWETLRILQGRPAPDKELTDEFNVLEAGLWNAVSLSKGCYKGQETIARLVTYDGIKQKLWGIRLSSLVEGGSVITFDGKKVGKLTSVTAGIRDSEPFGLGYIKRKGASAGDNFLVGGSVVGTLAEAPFLARQRPPSKNPTS